MNFHNYIVQLFSQLCSIQSPMVLYCVVKRNTHTHTHTHRVRRMQQEVPWSRKSEGDKQTNTTNKQPFIIDIYHKAYWYSQHVELFTYIKYKRCTHLTVNNTIFCLYWFKGHLNRSPISPKQSTIDKSEKEYQPHEKMGNETPCSSKIDPTRRLDPSLIISEA